MHRLFVALRPPPDIRAALSDVMGGVPGARWQDDSQLHLTLRFIGEVDGRQADDIALALSGVVAPPPALRIDGVGTFDRRGRVDTIWARAAPIDQLTALHRKVDQALGRAGVPPDPRRFLPHITLARVSRGGLDAIALERWIADHAALATPLFTCAHLTLFESLLGREGASYEAVARWPLG